MNTKTTMVTVVALALIGLASPVAAFADLETMRETSNIQYVGGVSDGGESPVATGIYNCDTGVAVGGCAVTCPDTGCTVSVNDDIHNAYDFNYRCLDATGTSQSSSGGSVEHDGCEGGLLSVWIHLGATTGTISVS